MAKQAASIKPILPAELTYLLPREESFWRWGSDGRAIEWRDGRTIAFREEIIAVLQRLAPAGLPPFGSIVLLLAATRDNWNLVNDKAGAILARYLPGGSLMSRTAPVIATVIPHRARQEVTDILGDLEAVAGLADEVRTSPAAKIALVEMVFDGMPMQLSSFDADKVVSNLIGGIDPAILARKNGRDENYQQLAADLDALRGGLGRVGTEPLTLWMRAGIDREVEPADIDLPPAERVRGLMRDLRNDAKLAGLAKLAQDLLAAVHVPRADLAGRSPRRRRIRHRQPRPARSAIAQRTGLR